MRTSYQELCKLFKSKDCTLLTTQQEYDEKQMVKQDKFRYIAKCGHEHEVYGTNFMQNSGIYCKTCANIKGRENRKETKTVKLQTKDIIELFEEILGDTELIRWKLTADKYSFSDVFICGKDNDKWMRVQLRYSVKNTLKVSIHSDLDESFVIVCFNNTDNVWIIPDHEVKDLVTVNISQTENTKYAPYKTTRHQLVSQLVKYANNIRVKADVNRTMKFVYDTAFDFGKISEIVSAKNCQILTQREDYESQKMTTKSPLQFKMTCGHDMSCSINAFQKRKHFVCQNCIYQKLQNTSYNHDERAPSSALLEANAFDFIKNLIANDFECIKSHESCLADMLVKPNNIQRDEWIGIQLKSRTHESKKVHYMFNKVGKYPNMIVICIAIPQYKIWLFNGNDLIGQQGLSIGINKSKYESNEVTKSTICDKILALYNILPKKTLDSLIVPVAIPSQKEHTNRIQREKLFPNLSFEYPRFDGTKYDVIINGYKVQDKCTSTKTKGSKTYYCAYLRDYKKGDNDFYWINMSNGSFYIIPETAIIQDCGTKIRISVHLSKKFDIYLYDKNRLDDVYKVFQRA